MSPNKLLRKLSQNLLEILDDNEYYDTTIEVGNDPYVKIFRAHMVILNYRSTYLRRILSTNKRKNDEILVQIKLPNILPDIFQIVLRYIYGGTLSLEDYDNLDIVKILVAAKELNLHELIAYIQSYLTKNKADWMEQNFNLIYQTSFDDNSFLKLQTYCTNLMSKYPDKILKSLDFSSVSENVLMSLIQSDNLQMSEIQVWENVLKWGLAQNPGLSSDLSNYSKDDFNSLKNTLQPCIPFVRFYNLTSQEFSDHVLPYKEVLPEELYMHLLKTFLSLNPSSKPSHKSNPRKIKEIVSPSPPISSYTPPPPRSSNSPPPRPSNSPPPRPSNSPPPRSSFPPSLASNLLPPEPLSNTPSPRPSSYTPPPRSSNSPPPRSSYTLPPRSSNSPPPRPSVYTPPPPRPSSYTPPSRPSSYTPPSRPSSYTPPSRPSSYTPPPRPSYSPPPGRPYTPPMPSYSAPLRPTYSPPLRPSYQHSNNSTDSLEIEFNDLNIQPQPSSSRLSNYNEDLIDFSEPDYQIERPYDSESSQEISEEYEEKLKILENMGFSMHNKEEILGALREFDGDLDAVINNLL